MKKSIVRDQEYFFNINAENKKVYELDKIFYEYANKEQVRTLKWIEDCQKILEYGCGTGTSIDIFLKGKKRHKYQIVGVDIAGLAIKQAKKNYPKFTFYKISDNKMPRIKDNSLDAAYMFHVLHHSKNHPDIFSEINSKLKKGGKFLINDLSSQNIFIRFGRKLFSWFPNLFKNKFKDDLVVDGQIPDKYKVSIPRVLKQLRAAGFVIEEVGYGHLFFILIIWIDRFIRLSKFKTFKKIFKQLIAFENYLLQFSFFKKGAEVFYVKCYKKS